MRNCLRSGRSRSFYLSTTYKKGDKRDCSNYTGLSHLTTTYTLLSNILLSRLTPYAGEIIGDHPCRFRRNRSTTDHTLCFRQMLEKKREYNKVVYQVFIELKNAFDSIRREVLYNILSQIGIVMKLVRLINMCLNEPVAQTR